MVSWYCKHPFDREKVQKYGFATSEVHKRLVDPSEDFKVQNSDKASLPFKWKSPFSSIWICLELWHWMSWWFVNFKDRVAIWCRFEYEIIEIPKHF